VSYTVVVLSVIPGGHEIIPEPGSARRVRDGEPADMLNPTHYPAIAVCLTCRQPIRCDGWLLGEWYHAEPES
jgi:hypothetical protein